MATIRLLGPALGGLIWLAGCAEAPRPAPPLRPVPASEPASRLAELEQLSSFLRTREFASQHPVRSTKATLYLGPGAERYGERDRPPMAEGALLVMALETEASGLLYYVMRKGAAGSFPEGGDWEYAVALPDGRLRSRGALRVCARCHAEAPRQHLFEPPIREPSGP